MKCQVETQLDCALGQIAILEPETCRKGEAESWEFSGYGDWLNIGHAESELCETLAACLLPNKLLAKGWGASLRVERFTDGYRELSLTWPWANDSEMFAGVPEDSGVKITIWEWDGLTQGPVLAELGGRREHFKQVFIRCYAAALEAISRRTTAA